ncbi:MAG: RsmE family RNA methyltransferase [Verrucomicrobia bacterium]|nr:RsmE family RNA methyltransferase [Verrucomicrobiota bacterium]
MHRFFLPPSECRGEVVTLRAADARHALNVLRLSPGADVQILNGEGECLSGELLEGSRKQVTVRISTRRKQAQPAQRLGLAIAQLKPKAMDLSLQKATELGVDDIWLIESDRSVSRWSGKEVPVKLEKLNLTLIEAMKQCGAVWKPRLHGPIKIEALKSELGEAWAIAFGNLHDSVEPLPVWKAAQSFQNASTCWCVGPEGDFTNGEVQTLINSGAVPVDLGQLVLRSETAVVCGLSVFGQWRYFLNQMEA